MRTKKRKLAHKSAAEKAIDMIERRANTPIARREASQRELEIRAKRLLAMLNPVEMERAREYAKKHGMLADLDRMAARRTKHSSS